MPTPASAAIVAMGTRGPSRCTARVAARTRAWWLRAASLRGSRELRMAAMRLLKLSLPPPARALHSNGRNPPDFAGLPPDLIRQPPPSKPQGGSMPSQPAPIPPDDPSRRLTVAWPDEDQSLPHIGLVGDTYTILDGEVRVTFRGETIVARAGQTINVPANAPHAFINAGEAPVRLLCLCAPAGQEEFFTLVGQPVATRTEPPPRLDAEAQAAFIAKSMMLAPQYKTELLPPPSHG